MFDQIDLSMRQPPHDRNSLEASKCPSNEAKDDMGTNFGKAKSELISQNPRASTSAEIPFCDNFDNEISSSESGEGIINLVRPAILKLDAQVKKTVQSQQILSEKISEITKGLNLLMDEEYSKTFDIDEVRQRIDKLAEARQRAKTTTERLDSLKTRIFALKSQVSTREQFQVGQQQSTLSPKKHNNQPTDRLK